MITGVDLVEWQLRVAGGEPLPAPQTNFSTPRGHAFEARIYAEDASSNFMPSTGQIKLLKLPTLNDGVRVETGIRQGDEISVYYDPMIAKLVVWSEDRSSALMKLRQSLSEYRIAGVKTNLDYLVRLASHSQFESGHIYTDFIGDHSDELQPRLINDESQKTLLANVAALSLMIDELSNNSYSSSFVSNDVHSPFANRQLLGSSYGQHNLKLLSNDKTFNVRIEIKSKKVYLIQDADEMVEVEVDYDANQGQLTLSNLENGTRQTFQVSIYKDRMCTVHSKQYGSIDYELESPSFVNSKAERNSGSSTTFDGQHILSPMPAIVENILVKQGDTVKDGDTLAIVTAMKMAHTIKASFGDSNQARQVEQVFHKPGDNIAKGAKILKFSDN